MKLIKRVALLLRIVDDTGNLDLVDLAFIAMIVKIVVAPNVDYPSMCSLLGLVLSKMHRYHLQFKDGKETIVDEDKTS